MSRFGNVRDVERIVVRGPNWLGDLVMSTPGFRALRQAYPRARIVVLVPEALAPILAGNDDVDEVWPIASRGVGAMRSAAERIAKERFDLGLVIPESISSALLMRWGRVDWIAGYARDSLRRMLLHEVVPSRAEWGRRRFVSKERFVLGLMEAVGAAAGDTRLRLAVTREEDQRLASLLGTIGSGLQDLEEKPPVVIAPGASFGDSKCWPIESYAAFAGASAERGDRIVLIGTDSERERVRAVRDACGFAPLDLAGHLDLGTLKALLSRARLLVANDAGARHVATAFDVPAVIFFGPTSVAKTDTNLDRIEVLETEHDCRPCYRRSCPIDHRCMTSISVEEAMAASARAVAAGCHRAGMPAAREASASVGEVGGRC